MTKLAKKVCRGKQKVDREKRYQMDEAMELLPQVSYAKFDETVELALRLGVDPKTCRSDGKGECRPSQRAWQDGEGTCLCKRSEGERSRGGRC